MAGAGGGWYALLTRPSSRRPHRVGSWPCSQFAQRTACPRAIEAPPPCSLPSPASRRSVRGDGRQSPDPDGGRSAQLECCPPVGGGGRAVPGGAGDPGSGARPAYLRWTCPAGNDGGADAWCVRDRSGRWPGSSRRSCSGKRRRRRKFASGHRYRVLATIGAITIPAAGSGGRARDEARVNWPVPPPAARGSVAERASEVVACRRRTFGLGPSQRSGSMRWRTVRPRGPQPPSAIVASPGTRSRVGWQRVWAGSSG